MKTTEETKVITTMKIPKMKRAARRKRKKKIQNPRAKANPKLKTKRMQLPQPQKSQNASNNDVKASNQTIFTIYLSNIFSSDQYFYQIK